MKNLEKFGTPISKKDQSSINGGSIGPCYSDCRMVCTDGVFSSHCVLTCTIVCNEP